MKDRNMTATLLLTAIAACSLVYASAARAQTYDHLKCFKIKDQKTFKKAQASLWALQGQFGAFQNCVIKGKAKEFCVPVDKNVTFIEGGATQTVDGEDLLFDRLCYKLKCDKLDIAPEEVSDQFGTRDIEKFKISTICTPAVKGPPPTTTTTTLPPLDPCIGGSPWPICSGDCSHLGPTHDCDSRPDELCGCVLPCADIDPLSGGLCGAGGQCPVDSSCQRVIDVCGCVFDPGS